MRRLTGVVASLVLGLGGAVTAVVPQAGATTTAIVKSTNSAGYTATASTPVTTFSGTLNVPTITCPATGSPTVVAGINLFDPSSSVQVGFSWIVFCSSGTASYNSVSASISHQGSFASGGVTVHPGDSLSFSMTEGASTLKASVTNSTTGYGASASAPLHPSLSTITAETSFSNGGSGNVTPIPSFTQIHYGTLKFNGALLSTMSPTEIEMYDGTTLQVATSAISLTGTFTNTFKHV